MRKAVHISKIKQGQNLATDNSSIFMAPTPTVRKRRKGKRKKTASTERNKTIKTNSHMKSATTAFLEHLKDYPLLDRKTEMRVGKELKSKNPRTRQLARNILVKHNLRMVVGLAKKRMGNGVPLEDLIEDGIAGLMKATTKYDVNVGVKFDTYSYWWIRQKIGKSAAENKSDLKIPVHMRNQINQMKRAYHKLTLEYGRQPSNQEIADELNKTTKREHFTAKKIMEMKMYDTPEESIDSPVKSNGDNDNSVVGDFIPDTSTVDPTAAISNDQLRNDLLKAIDTLSERDEKVLTMTYGLNSRHKIYPPEVIARALNVPYDKLPYMQTQAIKRLRHPARSEDLKKYISEKRSNDNSDTNHKHIKYRSFNKN